MAHKTLARIVHEFINDNPGKTRGELYTLLLGAGVTHTKATSALCTISKLKSHGYVVATPSADRSLTYTIGKPFDQLDYTAATRLPGVNPKVNSHLTPSRKRTAAPIPTASIKKSFAERVCEFLVDYPEGLTRAQLVAKMVVKGIIKSTDDRNLRKPLQYLVKARILSAVKLDTLFMPFNYTLLRRFSAKAFNKAKSGGVVKKAVVPYLPTVADQLVLGLVTVPKSKPHSTKVALALQCLRRGHDVKKTVEYFELTKVDIIELLSVKFARAKTQPEV